MHQPTPIEAAIARIEANGRAAGARTARIKADPRIVRLSAMRNRRPYAHGQAGAGQVFADMASGAMAREGRINALVRARVGQLDQNIHAVRRGLKDAAHARNGNHWSKPLPHTALTASEAGERELAVA